MNHDHPPPPNPPDGSPAQKPNAALTGHPCKPNLDVATWYLFPATQLGPEPLCEEKNRVNCYSADQLVGTKKKNPTSHFRIREEKKCWKMIPWSLTQFGDTCMRHAANTHANSRNASSSPLRYACATTASCKLHMQGTRNEKANSPQACIGFPRILKRNFFFPFGGLLLLVLLSRFNDE
jgi:hypothetical protein